MMDYDSWKLQTPEQFLGLPDEPLEEVDCQQCNELVSIWWEEELEEFQSKGYAICEHCNMINAENPDYEEN